MRAPRRHRWSPSRNRSGFSACGAQPHAEAFPSHRSQLDVQKRVGAWTPRRADIAALGQRSARAAAPRTRELSVRLVGRAEGRKLNAQYRGKDYATNVLSFPASPCGAALARAVPAARRYAPGRPRDLPARAAHRSARAAQDLARPLGAPRRARLAASHRFRSRARRRCASHGAPRNRRAQVGCTDSQCSRFQRQPRYLRSTLVREDFSNQLGEKVIRMSKDLNATRPVAQEDRANPRGAPGPRRSRRHSPCRGRARRHRR